MSATVQEAADRIHSAAIHLLRRVRVEDDTSGLTPARLSALSVVVFTGPLPIGRLAAAEGVKPPTMTRIAAALERDGLVRRTGGRDRRSVEIAATAAGRRVLQRARERRLGALAGLLGGLSPTDVQTIAAAAELIDRAVSREA